MELIKELKCKISYPDTIDVYGADGTRLKVMGRVHLDFKVKESNFNHNFTVLDKCRPPLILGADLLELYGAKIDYSKMLIDINAPDNSYFEHEPEEIKKEKLKAAIDVIIPEYSVLFVPITSKLSPKLLIVEADPLFIERTGMLLSRCIFMGNNMPAIPVVNMFPFPQKILKNTTIARAEHIPEPLKVCTLQESKQMELEGLPKSQSNCFDISPALGSEEYEQLSKLLNQYESLFSKEGERINQTSLTKHYIPTGNNAPLKQRPYRVSLAERLLIKEQVEEMCKDGIVRPSTSPWAAPVVLVKKKDGSPRFCVDYRRLNKVTIKDVYPLPRLDDIMDSLQGASFFSSLDLKSGYWQVAVNEEDKNKTVFITPDGLFEFNVMPFGLCNAPASFERLVDSILQEYKWKICLCYIDDIVVFSNNFSDHIERLETVLNCFHEAGLTMNTKKCRFAYTQLSIFGHIIDSSGVKPDPSRIKPVSEFPKPSTTKDVRSFLGLCSYYRRFIKGFANIANPLNSLLQKSKSFVWENKQEESFLTLKKCLTTAPILAIFTPGLPISIHTDASGYGIGAVILQKHGEMERVVAYASRTLSKAERNYSTTERECLAVVWATIKFRPYLFGASFTIVTDHHALCWLANLKDPSGRLARWAMRMQEFDFTICFKSGKKHLDADSLSRCPIDIPDDNIKICIVDKNKIEDKDEAYMENLKKILNKATDSNESIKENFKLENNYLFKRNPKPFGQSWLLIPSKPERKNILETYHSHPTSGHLGIARSFSRISSRFFWPSLFKDVENFVRTCHLCQTRKKPPTAPLGYLQPIPPTSVPYEKIGIDLVGPFPVTKKKNKWIVTTMDYHTKYLEAEALVSATAERVASFVLRKIILRHGAPKIIISDRGAQFMSKLLNELMKQSNIGHNPTTAYHPQTNGLTERVHRTLADMLSMYTNEWHTNWDDILPFVQFAYNTSVQEATGYSPFFLLHGREPTTTLETMFPYPTKELTNYDEYVQDLILTTQEARQIAYTSMLQRQVSYKTRYDKKHRVVQFQPGDLVCIWTPRRHVGLSEKLLRRYFGPYKVLKQTGPVNYLVISVEGRRPKPENVHVTRMKLYRPQDQ